MSQRFPPDSANHEWVNFEKELLELAAACAELRKDRFDHIPPKDVAHDLENLDKALTVALQAIGPLELEHEAGQDIITAPFNWPVVNALNAALGVMNAHS